MAWIKDNMVGVISVLLIIGAGGMGFYVTVLNNSNAVANIQEQLDEHEEEAEESFKVIRDKSIFGVEQDVEEIEDTVDTIDDTLRSVQRDVTELSKDYEELNENITIQTQILLEAIEKTQ